jgi:hypothetical protein
MRSPLLFTLAFASMLASACGHLEIVADDPPARGGAPDAAPGQEDAGVTLGPATGDGILLLSTYATDPDAVEIIAQFRSHTPEEQGGVAIPSGGCRLSTASDGSLPYVPDANAGTITARAGDQTLTLPWVDSARSYEWKALRVDLDVPITIHATGAAVPEFSVTTRRAHPIEPLNREEDGIDAGADFDVTWTPGPASQGLGIRLDGKGIAASCWTSADLGHFRISKDYVRAVTGDSGEEDGGPPYVALTIATSTFEHVRAGDYDVVLLAQHRPKDLRLPVRHE